LYRRQGDQGRALEVQKPKLSEVDWTATVLDKGGRFLFGMKKPPFTEGNRTKGRAAAVAGNNMSKKPADWFTIHAGERGPYRNTPKGRGG